MSEKLTLLNRLNLIFSVQNMPIHLDLSPMINYSGVEIEKFIRWPKGEDFKKYTYNDIIKNATYPQTKLTSEDIASGNFEILQCLNNNTIEISSFEKSLQLYEDYKYVLDIEND